MIRLAVFDLDGTLVDSQRDLANAANALVAELGGRQLREADVSMMVGEGAAVLVRRVLAAARLDPETPGALPRFLELYEDHLADHTVVYDGIADALAALAPRMPLAVLTNKPQRAADRLIELLGLRQYFQQVVGGDTPHGRKPDPTGLLAVCEGAGVVPEDAILVGDSPIDFQTARRAGTQVLLVSYGFGFRFDATTLESVRVVHAPSDITDHLAA